MTPKKTVKPVVREPEEVEVDMDALVRITEEETPPAKQWIDIDLKAKSAVLVAYADFEISLTKYEAGDVFTPPADWVRDDSFEVFRSVSHKNRGAQEIGIAFVVPGEIIDTKTKERDSRRVVLPLKEA